MLAVLRVRPTSKVVGKWDYGENRHFRNVVWANNKRLLFWVGFKLGSFDFKVGKGDLYASNIDGTGRIDIPNGAYYQRRRPDPGGSRHHPGAAIRGERIPVQAQREQRQVSTTVASRTDRWRQLPGRPRAQGALSRSAR